MFRSYDEIKEILLEPHLWPNYKTSVNGHALHNFHLVTSSGRMGLWSHPPQKIMHKDDIHASRSDNNFNNLKAITNTQTNGFTLSHIPSSTMSAESCILHIQFESI